MNMMNKNNLIYHTIPYGMVWCKVCGMVWYGMCSSIWYGMVCGMVWMVCEILCDMVCGMVWYSLWYWNVVVWYRMVWYGSVHQTRTCRGGASILAGLA